MHSSVSITRSERHLFKIFRHQPFVPIKRSPSTIHSFPLLFAPSFHSSSSSTRLFLLPSSISPCVGPFLFSLSSSFLASPPPVSSSTYFSDTSSVEESVPGGGAVGKLYQQCISQSCGCIAQLGSRRSKMFSEK